MSSYYFASNINGCAQAQSIPSTKFPIDTVARGARPKRKCGAALRFDPGLSVNKTKKRRTTKKTINVPMRRVINKVIYDQFTSHLKKDKPSDLNQPIKADMWKSQPFVVNELGRLEKVYHDPPAVLQNGSTRITYVLSDSNQTSNSVKEVYDSFKMS